MANPWKAFLEKIPRVPSERSIYAFFGSLLFFAGLSAVLSIEEAIAKVISLLIVVIAFCFLVYLGWKEANSRITRTPEETIPLKFQKGRFNNEDIEYINKLMEWHIDHEPNSGIVFQITIHPTPIETEVSDVKED